MNTVILAQRLNTDQLKTPIATCFYGFWLFVGSVIYSNFEDNLLLPLQSILVPLLAEGLVFFGTFLFWEVVIFLGLLLRNSLYPKEKKEDLLNLKWYTEDVLKSLKRILQRKPSPIFSQKEQWVHERMKKAEELEELSRNLRKNGLNNLADTVDTRAQNVVYEARLLMKVKKANVLTSGFVIWLRKLKERLEPFNKLRQFLQSQKWLLAAIISSPIPSDLSLLRIPTTKPNAPAYL